jgi:hypothetical protein
MAINVLSSITDRSTASFSKITVTYVSTTAGYGLCFSNGPDGSTAFFQYQHYYPELQCVAMVKISNINLYSRISVSGVNRYQQNHCECQNPFSIYNVYLIPISYEIPVIHKITSECMKNISLFLIKQEHFLGA